MNRKHECITQMARPKTAGLVFVTSMAILFAAGPAHSQEVPNGDGYITDLKNCQTITEDAARLNCYDAAVGKVVAASDNGNVRIVSEAEVAKTKRGLFGLNINLFGGSDDKDAELDLLQSVITKVSVSGSTVFITIEEGNAVWKIPNAKPRIKRAKPGDTVEFKKASFGSYFIRINGRIGVKGSRVS